MASCTSLLAVGIICGLLAQLHVSQVIDGCSWVNVTNQRLVNWNNETVTTGNLEACQSMCEHHKDFKCRSVDFNQVERECVLSEGDRADSYLGDADDWQYSEIQCQEEWRNRSSCTLVGPVQGKIMFDSTLRFNVRPDSTVEKCEAACRQEQRFFCIAFNFRESSGMCALQELDSHMRRLVEVPPFVYYELNCDPDVDPTIWLPPAVHVGISDDRLCSIRGPVIGYSGPVEQNTCAIEATLTQCEKKFIEMSAVVEMKAFSYNPLTGTCRMHRESRENEPLVATAGFNYYEYSCKFSEDLVNQCLHFAP
ncbi:hypothetical protein CAPTEDRAFT_217406 [Capitella teleta]|uniref:Apple domain-containing protein n=1 Tax=Capitella teleta TaxID=283909 RepID=R7TMW2_CAPTE|nr:hypothetical protein CAPTEDRAFT_217406 [Capitella teleta]|eukprot:ELT95213.1 hypothetical protein CAPTEDRAFT_217406 [Capitella teleta]